MFYSNLYKEFCSFRNLELAYRKARKGKRIKKSVQDFEASLEQNLFQLKHELETGIYRPRPLRQFVIRDPKTRLISASDFRDRVVYHALCNIIQPIFEKTFIYDSHANQLEKGSTRAIERFDKFKGKVSENGKLVNNAKDNNMIIGYVLKADIKHFFDTVDHEILLNVLSRKIRDQNIMDLIKKILANHRIKESGKGMPLGNLTSQFFANVYLNELDYFVKHKLEFKYYIRYVDDFVLLDKSKEKLEDFKNEIGRFLKTIKLELHPEKSVVYQLNKGLKFLGFRIFYHYKLLNKTNLRRIEIKLEHYKRGLIDSEPLKKYLSGWSGYAVQANTYKLRKELKTASEASNS